MSSRRIPDPGSLIAGITFAGVGLIFLVGKVDLADRARWVWPIVLVGLGAGLLAAVLRRSATPAAAGPAATSTGQPPATSTGQPPATSTLPPSGEAGATAGLPYEPSAEAEANHALAVRDQAEPPARDAALVDGAEVERGPAQESADEASREKDQPGGDLPRRPEP
jgi:hypothetical protein